MAGQAGTQEKSEDYSEAHPGITRRMVRAGASALVQRMEPELGVTFPCDEEDVALAVYSAMEAARSPSRH